MQIDGAFPILEINTPERSAVIQALGIRNSEPEEGFDLVTTIGRELLGVPFCIFSVITGESLFLRSGAGSGIRLGETSLDQSLCKYVVARHEPIIVSDIRKDPVFKDLCGFEGLSVVAYAGVPVSSPCGQLIGVLCAVDTKARSWSVGDVTQLRRLTSLLEEHLRLGLALKQQISRASNIEKIASHVPEVVYQYRVNREGSVSSLYVSEAVRVVFGVEPESVLKNSRLLVQMRHPQDSERVRDLSREAEKMFTAWKAEYRIIRGDREIRWVQESAVPERQPDGSTLWLGYIADVTAQRRSSEELELFSCNMPESIVFQLRLSEDDRFQFVYASEGVTQFHNLSPDLIKRDPNSYFDQMCPEQRSNFISALYRSAHEMSPFEFEVDFEVMENVHVWMHIRASPHRDNFGALVWNASETNISERRLAEARERRSNRALATLSRCNEIIARAETEESMRDMVCNSLVEDGGYIAAWIGFPEYDDDQSIRVAAVSGTSKIKIDRLQLSWGDNDRGRGPTGSVIRTGKTGLSTSFPQPAHTSTPWAKGLNEQAVRSVIAFRLNLDSRESGVLTVYAPESIDYDERERSLLLKLSENLAFGINSIRAQKERSRALASLSETSERLSIALRAAALGVWTLDLSKLWMMWDDRTSEIFGLSKESRVIHFEEILLRVHAEDRALVQGLWLSTKASGRAIALRFRVVGPTGSSRHVEVQGVLHHGGSGEFLRALGVIWDITEVVESTTEAVQLRAQLASAGKMEALGRIASGVAHDFNNLLTGISGLVEMAAGSLPDSHEAFKLLEEAKGGARNARKLVSTILDFSRRKDGEGHRILDLGDLVKQMTPLISAAMPRNVVLRSDLDRDPVFIKGDSNQLFQVLINLCVNGAYAIGKNRGNLEISLARCSLKGATAFVSGSLDRGSYARLSVCDTGCGMSEATLSRLFEPLFTTRSDLGGTGLGLTIVRDAVAAHKGAVDVQSKLGEGSGFSVYIPLCDPKAEGDFVSTGANSESGRGRRLLVVDDEQVILDVLRESLAQVGFVPEYFSDPKAALAHFRANYEKYDLLLVDQRMPGMNGWQFAKEARLLKPSLFVTVMSGEPINTAEIEQLGFNSIRKPFRFKDLLSLLTRADRRA